MRVAIVGSREYPFPSRVEAYVDTLPKGTVVVSGAARGVDKFAAACARLRGFEVVEFLPDYDLYGPAIAPLERNKIIAAKCDRMVAFWDGSSTGTMHAVGCARKLGKPVEILR